MRIDVPPLRERREDIPLLVDHFLAKFRRALGKEVRGIADEALERLCAYAWPGNVRELENVMERGVILCRGDRITTDELPEAIGRGEAAAGESVGGELSIKKARRRAEIEVIRRALQATGGNRTHAAKLLEISHRALLYKLKEYGIND